METDRGSAGGRASAPRASRPARGAVSATGGRAGAGAGDVPLKAVVFDLDDTLVHGLDPATGEELDLHRMSWLEILGSRGLALGPDEYLERMKGHTNAACEAFLQQRFGVDADGNLAAAKERYYRDNLLPRHLRLREGAEALLRELRRQGLHVAILTNAPPANVAAAERHLSLSHLVPAHCILTERDLIAAGRRPKPAPDGLQLLAQRLGISCAEMVYVGDSRHDVAAAVAAGVVAIAIEASLDAARLLALGAAKTFRHFGELTVPALRQLAHAAQTGRLGKAAR